MCEFGELVNNCDVEMKFETSITGLKMKTVRKMKHHVNCACDIANLPVGPIPPSDPLYVNAVAMLENKG